MATEFDLALLARRTNEATRGDSDAAYELGVAYSTGTMGAVLDLIEAHKWFNLSAARGNVAAAAARSEIAEDMTAREIATAQRAARDVLGGMQRRAA
jgi:TPR repeat protein